MKSRERAPSSRDDSPRPRVEGISHSQGLAKGKFSDFVTAGVTYPDGLVWKASTAGQVDLASQVSARGCARMCAGPPDQLSISISRCAGWDVEGVEGDSLPQTQTSA